MFKKGDVVEGLLSKALYECLEEEKDDCILVECLVTGNGGMTVGSRGLVPVDRLILWQGPAAVPVPEEIEKQKEPGKDLIEARRALKKFLFGS
jgi:hypothetical protein